MIAMTPLRTIALALGVALPVGALLSFLPEWRGEPGPMECTAFVDILGEHRWIPPNRLHEELVKRGVTLPSPPSLSLAPPYSGSKVESRLREYESAKKVYEAKWEEIEGSPEYQRASLALRSKSRDEALRACLFFRRIQEEGAVP